MTKNNILYFPDMTKNYKQELEKTLEDLLDKAVNGETLAILNAQYFLTLRQQGLPEHLLNQAFSTTVKKACYEFEIKIKKIKRVKK